MSITHKQSPSGSGGGSYSPVVDTFLASSNTGEMQSALDLATYLASPDAIGGTVAAAGAFTTLSVAGILTLTDGRIRPQAGGQFQFQDAGGADLLEITERGAIHAVEGAANGGVLLDYLSLDSSYKGLWVGSAAVAPTINNYSFLGSDTQTLFNGPVSGDLSFRINNVAVTTLTDSDITFLEKLILASNIIRPSTDSTAAIQFQNAAGSTDIFTIDSTSPNTRVNSGNLILNSGNIILSGSSATVTGAGMFSKGENAEFRYLNSSNAVRWRTILIGAESTGDLGANWELQAWGTGQIDSPISIGRAAGEPITFSRPVQSSNTVQASNILFDTISASEPSSPTTGYRWLELDGLGLPVNAGWFWNGTLWLSLEEKIFRYRLERDTTGYTATGENTSNPGSASYGVFLVDFEYIYLAPTANNTSNWTVGLRERLFPGLSGGVQFVTEVLVPTDTETIGNVAINTLVVDDLAEVFAFVNPADANATEIQLVANAKYRLAR